MIRIGLVLIACIALLPSGCKKEDASPERLPADDHSGRTAQDWCAEHGVPESKCTKCNPELIPKFKAAGDWCASHGLPESVCPICRGTGHPPAPGGSAAAGNDPADWCAGHGVPESKCTKCNPELIPKFKAAGDWCASHGLPESVCPICNPGKNGPLGNASSIRFRSPEIERKSGIATVAAQRLSLPSTITCPGRIEYDQNRVADVRAVLPGVVRKIHVDLGQNVKKGATLFSLDSTRAGELQGQLREAQGRIVAARADLDRKRQLREGDITSARQVEVAAQELAVAEAQERSARAALNMAGASTTAGSGSYAVRSPIAGSVVRRPAVVGSLATDETSLATIADATVMWALCDVPEMDVARVKPEQKAVVQVDGSDEGVAGVVTWLAPEVDVRTRTVTARVEIDNARGLLRANQFSRIQIEVGEAHSSVSVPRESLQRLGDTTFVFVRTAAGAYEARPVRSLGAANDAVSVEGEVHEGDAVVTAGAYLLKTELQPGAIGSGCCEVDRKGG